MRFSISQVSKLLRQKNDCTNSPQTKLRRVKYAVSTLLLGVAIAIAAYEIDSQQLSLAKNSVDATTLITAGCAILVSSIFAAMRVRTIAASHGYSLSLREAVAVISLGQIGGLVFFQIFGQLIARGSYLGKRMIPFSGTVLITAHERLAAALASLSLAVIGAVYIFRDLNFDLAGGGFELVHILTGLSLAGAVTARIWWSTVVRTLSQLTLRAIAQFLQSFALSVAVQLSMMAAYIAIGHSIAPDAGFYALAAASSLVMFAASIPISFAGWGIRELSAVAALGAIGMSTPKALIVAIIVGVISIICAALLSALSVRSVGPSTGSPGNAVTVPAVSHEIILQYSLPILCALLVFFNVHIPGQTGLLNVNLADPIAILSGVLFLLSILRSTAPSWRLRELNIYVIVCSIVITVSLLIGATSIGWTQWAVTNKWLGWFVLLGYGAAGAMASRLKFAKILNTFVSVGCVIIGYQLFFLVLTMLGLRAWSPFAGFAQNSNAFSFQCLMVLSAAIALRPALPITISLALVSICYTGSRAGIASAAIVLVLSFILSPGYRRKLAIALTMAAAVLTALSLTPHLFSFLSGSLLSVLDLTISPTSHSAVSALTTARDGSTAEHFESMWGGLSLFAQHPFFGAGLGTFIHQSKELTPLVIHSTLIWLLAEFGMIGAVAFILPIVRIFANEILRPQDPAGTLIILAITGFGAMSIFHEMMYQRTFWFLLGAALAVPYHTVGRPVGKANT
ncbi:hypothetical protein RPMA_09680 [Tardiphaga alba]|uniref:O-antigen ligase-related domain-containing protein n=1 Tax=Tardiphaga alba TaxID=340268 RepID=A0ABX8A5T2_9BRAD|nr:lysylphosphatidylglycerol synthase domain-containing protein [Tardiphaga alba]QUS39074.1 hypothetical protein RPMA_09680 [Tardiphaga alba]